MAIKKKITNKKDSLESENADTESDDVDDSESELKQTKKLQVIILSTEEMYKVFLGISIFIPQKL